MASRHVPAVHTAPSKDDFARALLRAWPEATKSAAAVLWGHYALETENGKHCYGWNLGNVKYVPGCGYDYHVLRGVFEYDAQGKRLDLPVDDPGSRFRAYGSLDEGMRSHLALLRGGRYAPAWALGLKGDAEGFARELGRLGYYTAPVAAYVAAMRPGVSAWLASRAFADAAQELAGSGAAQVGLAVDESGWVTVACEGVLWKVAPVYVAPVGIGEAEDLAKKLGCELPSPALVDAIWSVADLKIDAAKMVVSDHDGTPATMNSDATHIRQALKIEAAVGGRSLGFEFHLLAGAYKDVCVSGGKVGIYGWHRADGSVIQPFWAGHAKAWKDYSQGLRLVRRA